MEKMGIRNDFVVESNGRCFLCLQQNSSVSPNNPMPVSKHGLVFSLQSLSEFLGINMKTVFKWTETIPPDLLKRVEQSKLKVELCSECGCLIDNFRKLYRQFEKIQMGMLLSLETIKEKLLPCGETKEVDLFSELTDPIGNSRSDVSEKLDIMKSLRNETIKKCSSKLHAISPLVRIQNMTRGTLNKEKLKLKAKRFSSVDNPSFPYPSYASSSDSIIKVENAKAEPQLASLVSHDASERGSYSDDADNNDSMDSFSSADLEDAKFEPNQSSNLNDEQDTDRSNSTMDPTQHDKRPKGGKKAASKYFVEVAPPGLKRATMTIPQSLFDNKTEKISCPSCRSTFSHNKFYRVHYKSMHLGIRYQCTYDQCKKKFTQKAHCYQHDQIVHKGVRFRCRTCGKHFRGKYSLTNHLALASCHLRLASKMNSAYHCKFCGEGFTMRCNMNRHIRKFHR